MSNEIPNYHCKPDSDRTTAAESEVDPASACSASLTLRDPKKLPELDGEILVALWGISEWEVVTVRENPGGPFTAEYKGSGKPADPSEWQWWADLEETQRQNDATEPPPK